MKRIVDKTFAVVRIDTLKNVFLLADTHEKLLRRCKNHGGRCVYNYSGSRDIAYEFKDNLFVPDCLLSWNKTHFAGANLQLYLPQIGCLWKYIDTFCM